MVKALFIIIEYGAIKLSTDGTWFTLSDSMHDQGHTYEITLPNECIIPAFQAVLN